MNTFIFKAAHYDSSNSNIVLNYAYLNGPEFTETIHFPEAKSALTSDELYALNKAIKQLHLAAGISYYKTYCPKKIKIETYSLNQNEANFFYKFYLMGLGEFSVVNDIDLKNNISFPVESNIPSTGSNLSLPKASVVPIGGGKDSIVSLEILKQAKHPLRMIAINAGKPIKEVMKVGNIENSIHISRRIDPVLFSLNDEGAMNGHVPITGILSFIMVCAGILYGYDSVVMSNEGSASEGNMNFNEIEINHQYSKSLEFERDFENHIQNHVMKNFKYFSLLRPLTETGIACLFSKQTQYFDSFKSCNRNFHIDEGVRKYGWCCNCPKCHFVFLALSPFIEKETLINIFGKNLLDDPDQENGFRELVGLQGHKPFECVGEIGECQEIITHLSITDTWQNDFLVKKLASELEIKPLGLNELKNKALSHTYNHNIPHDYLEFLNDFIKSNR